MIKHSLFSSKLNCISIFVTIVSIAYKLHYWWWTYMYNDIVMARYPSLTFSQPHTPTKWLCLSLQSFYVFCHKVTIKTCEYYSTKCNIVSHMNIPHQGKTMKWMVCVNLLCNANTARNILIKINLQQEREFVT